MSYRRQQSSRRDDYDDRRENTDWDDLYRDVVEGGASFSETEGMNLEQLMSNVDYAPLEWSVGHHSS